MNAGKPQWRTVTHIHSVELHVPLDQTFVFSFQIQVFEVFMSLIILNVN